MKGKTEKEENILYFDGKPGNGRSLEAGVYHTFDQAI